MSRFGSQMLPTMLRMDWSVGDGWSRPALIPYGNIEVSPAAQVFHYGQAVFEGVRAYRQDDGRYAVFRPDENAKRFQRSCARMAIPELPTMSFIDAVTSVVAANLDALDDPARPESIYLRPFIVATEPSLGFYGRSSDFAFMVLALPMQQYFGDRTRMLRVLVQDEFSRAFPRGVGFAKCAGNYAGTILAQENAAGADCDQVLWLDGPTQQWIEEFSTSNVFFVLGDELLTPSLNDAFLPGITRASVLDLARELGVPTVERKIAIQELLSAIESGQQVECFSCGTTASVTPVGTLVFKGREYRIGTKPGSVTEKIREELLAVQAGRSVRMPTWRHGV
ncbi:branched-chain amino acid aminotransferase [Mitsuaria sp. WAJ17]|uniref:branched-chain amino acid aminotransferase n=1 Tax=Mitsuaria sp. WAJ17 TaxID=2761452 RepID=UPI002106646D|nr:branched-chain amino acid aminotransferase [Mitsuaria sp. WAJ17]